LAGRSWAALADEHQRERGEVGRLAWVVGDWRSGAAPGPWLIAEIAFWSEDLPIGHAYRVWLRVFGAPGVGGPRARRPSPSN
jgi:hypothetical protein